MSSALDSGFLVASRALVLDRTTYALALVFLPIPTGRSHSRIVVIIAVIHIVYSLFPPLDMHLPPIHT